MILPTAEGFFPELMPGPLQRFIGDVGLGNGVIVRLGAMRTGGGLFVGVVGCGAGEVTDAWGADDVMRHFMMAEPDAENLADLLNDQVCRAERLERLGTYDPVCCAEKEWSDG